MWYIRETSYLKKYFELLERDYSLYDGVVEKHHVQPVAFGGKGGEIKEVPPFIHIELHYLLFKHFSELGDLPGIKRSEKAFLLMAGARDFKDDEMEKIFEKYDEVRSSHIENMKGDGNPMFGKKRPEHSQKMSGSGNPMFGITHSEEKWEKIRKKLKGKQAGAKNNSAKKWILISPEGDTIFIHGELVKTTKELGLSENSLRKNLGKEVEYNRYARGKAFKNTIGWKLLLGE